MFVSVAPAALPMPSSCFLNRRSTETILFSHILKAGYQSIHVLMCTETTGKKKSIIAVPRKTYLSTFNGVFLPIPVKDNFKRHLIYFS